MSNGTRATLPPRRRCPSCGTTFHAWQSSGVCQRCRRGQQTDGTLAEIRRARAERLRASGLPEEEVRSRVETEHNSSVPRNTIPY